MGGQDPDRSLLPERDHSNLRGPNKGTAANVPRSAPVRTTGSKARRHLSRKPRSSRQEPSFRETRISPVESSSCLLQEWPDIRPSQKQYCQDACGHEGDRNATTPSAPMYIGLNVWCFRDHRFPLRLIKLNGRFLFRSCCLHSWCL